MPDENRGVIIPMEGTTSPNKMRESMLSLASVAQLLSFNAFLRGDKKTWGAYSLIVIAAAGLAESLS